MSKDYYKILGVARGASGEEIKKAYRRLAHQFHPDKPGGNEQKFKEVNEAYQTLSDNNKRVQYDRFGTAEQPGWAGAGAAGPGAGWNWSWGEGGNSQVFTDFGDLSDIFDVMFDGGGIRPRRRTYQQGSDLEVVREITLEESFQGATKTINLRTYIVCKHCRGQGAEAGVATKACGACDGRGEVREQRRTFFGQFSKLRACEICRGAGQIPEKLCSACKGNGRVMNERSIVVEILPGVPNDQIVKIIGAGEAGERGAAAGDLYVRVKVKAHSRFERRGDDLVVRKEIAVYDLLLGRKIDLPTVEGRTIQVELPTHFNLKEYLRVPGEGMPRFGGSTRLATGRGDLLVDLTLKTPKKLGAKEKAILERLEKEGG
ncbi:MAG: J domain-containing protein [Candidatus Liptonbacteria bacterium]|nr:J domain-containing protein [Candidatus Liptonbacteria bacterium]